MKRALLPRDFIEDGAGDTAGMKKLLRVMLGGLLVVMFAACGQDGDGDDDGEDGSENGRRPAIVRVA